MIAKQNILALKGDTYVLASTLFGASPKANAALRSLTEKAVAKL